MKATEEEVRFEIERNVNAPEVEQSFIMKKKNDFLSLIEYPKTSNLVRAAFFEELHEFATTILNLQGDESIDYPELVHQTERLMAIMGVEHGDCYDWCPKDC
jgi:hypothetical protein